MMSRFAKHIVLLIGLISSVIEAYSKPTVEKNQKKTFLDSLVFNYENTIWGKNPAVPLKPLVDKNGSLPDLKDYGMYDDKPLLSTERTIFVDSTYKINLKPSAPKKVETEKDEHHQHIGLGFTIGGTAMTYDSDFGEGKLGFTPGFHFNYEYYPYRNWGFMIGVDMNFTTGNFTAKDYSDKYDMVDSEGDLLKFSYNVGEIQEQNRLAMLSIPICLAFSSNPFYAHGGFKFGIPVSIKYEQTLYDCDFKCEIPAYNTTITNAVALGLGEKTATYNGQFSSSPVLLLLTLDGGYRFQINKQFDVMCGIFFDKALYRLRFKASQDQDNVQYTKQSKVYDFLKTSGDIPAKLIHSSVLTGRQMTTGQRIAEGIGYTSFGLKVTVCYNSYGKDYFPSEDKESNEIPDVKK